ncbi:two pore domain potassium channel family protein [Pelagibius litoralis]|uniref:Two pore domain potassium channel family protein n=1 Tax=Pelagibius litoralis TaxID=374515 RepID=A0A967KB57_9PROT|nr:ion channel [Pelagibius litoralis]NIA72013.1 two pore domain potassium channel family protein [Pelagibius litoralis]
MQKPDRYWLPGLVLTLGLYVLVSLAVAETFDLFFVVMLATLVVCVTLFYRLFPGSYFTTIALANFLSVYACLFIFFVTSNFAAAGDWTLRLSFVLPILAFMAGVWLRRGAIHRLVRHESDARVHYSPRVFLWLIPVFAVGLATFLLPHRQLESETVNLILLASMGLISLLVLTVSRDVTAFLLETGLLFEDFFARASALMAPTLAFFTYYSFVVIVFAGIYRIIERIIPGPHFMIAGEARSITFVESLYFSIITLSTVGYGDLVPLSMLVRAIASLQIVIGVWLIIFGFSEVLRFAREHRLHGGQK